MLIGRFDAPTKLLAEKIILSESVGQRLVIRDCFVSDDELQQVVIASDLVAVPYRDVERPSGIITQVNKIKIAINAISSGYHELRIVGVSDAPIEKKRSTKLGFTLKRAGDDTAGDISVNLNIENPVCTLGQSLRAKVVSLTPSQTIQRQPVSVSLVSHAKFQKDDRPQPPSKAELKKAVARIRELLTDQYKDSTPAGRTELLQPLQKTASESVDKPVNHYALLSECAFAASVFNSVEAGWTACDQLESSYQVDELPHLGFIKKIKTKLDPESASALYSKGVGLSEQLIDNDRYSDASDLARTLGAALKKSLPRSKPEIDAITDRAKILARKYKLIQDDLEVLADDPTDKPANGKVGEFYCLAKQNFDQGLPYLAKGPASPLQQLALDEVALKKATPEQRLEIADRWWELAEDKKLSGYQRLALKHYQEIIPVLKGLEKIKVDGRIKEVQIAKLDGYETAIQLAKSSWRIEWKDGRIFDRAYLTRTHFFLVADSGESYKMEFRVTDTGVDVWNAEKSFFYSYTYQDFEIRCTRTDRQDKKVSGIGTRIAARRTQHTIEINRTTQMALDSTLVIRVNLNTMFGKLF